MQQNAIDWASRAPDQPFKGRPVAIMGASTGRLGTVRTQHGLRATLESLEAHALLKPEVMITFSRESFDDRGLVDEKARQVVAQMAAFAARVRRFGAQERRPPPQGARAGALRRDPRARYATHIPLA